MRMIIITLLGILLSIPASASDLYVSPTGNDNVSRAQNSTSTPWRTIGRAAWGSTNRGTPNAGEAAQAGDIVHVTGGIYDYQGSNPDRFLPVYNPANAGVSFVCEGDCVVTAPNANSPVIGASGRASTRWYADVNQGHRWTINACGLQAGCPTSGVVNTTPDTGPVICHNTTGCHIEGLVIDGGQRIDFRDNYNAIRIENVTGYVIRNNTAANFLGNNHNQSIVTIYGGRDGLIEHNSGDNAGSFVFFKDTNNSNPLGNNLIQFNKSTRMGEHYVFSITGENSNTIRQNVAIGGGMGISVLQGGFSGDLLINNTFIDLANAGIAHNGAGSGGRILNSVFVRPGTAVYMAGAGVPSTATLLTDRNVYSGFRQFQEGTNGRLTFDQWQATGRDINSANVDPQVDADGRLAVGSPARTVGRDANGGVIPAGAYITGTEQIGPGGGIVEPPTPVNCAVSPWAYDTATEWGACANGTQTRQETWRRTVITPPSNGGLGCPALTEFRTGIQSCVMPVDPCVADPLLVTVSSWPSSAEGSRQLRYTATVNGSVVTIRSLSLTFAPRSLVVTDSRGCQATR